MSSMEQLYQEVILDHYKSPRNFGALDTANRKAEGHNPLCGDKVSVYLEVKDDIIRSATFQGSGCAISTASASIMTEALVGKSVQEARSLFESFHRVVTGQSDEDAADEMGKLAVFQGVRKYPVRIKCATLAWHALQSALGDADETATTE